MDLRQALSRIPNRIQGLRRMAYNLWWCWHPAAWELFHMLDAQTWRESEENPLRMLAALPIEVLTKAAQDPIFTTQYDAVMEQFYREVDAPTPTSEGDGSAAAPILAYFSAEYGLHASLPLYAGGLGILAGDHLKQASDLGVPLVGVGMIYSAGYVWQRIREDGWQEELEQPLDRTYDPIVRVVDSDRQPLLVQVPLFDPAVYVAVWKVTVGRVTLYLMDTDVAVNQPWDRAIAYHLYASNPEQRLRQEIVLGMGGMRTLEVLGIQPAAIHLNEGHPSLALLERVRQLVRAGQDFYSAAQQVRDTTIFTTHTPVAAGTDVFPYQLIDKYLSPHYDEIGVTHDEFLALGANPDNPAAGFNMTVFSLRMASHRNAVSRRHGEVARTMWHGLWPETPAERAPIAAITNGVHLGSWVDPFSLQPLFARYLGADWAAQQDRPDIWQAIASIPDEELWRTHQHLKASLLAEIDDRVRQRWQRDRVSASTVVGLGALLNPEVLTLGFARRFTGYKRPSLIFHDLERIKRLLTDPWHPVQIIFAGKAHPADVEGKRLIQTIFQWAQDPSFGGRLAFVEDYDQELAEYLVRGVDVWLNNPLPPLEASGTSGMKAAVNGVPNLSILDGWWIEGYNGENGWAFGGEDVPGDRTAADAEALCRLLEEQVVPLYYERSDDGVPHDFVRVMKAAIQSIAPAFGAQRMLKAYLSQCYTPALAQGSPATSPAA